MNRKIELLLQVAADFHDFCESNTSFTTLSCPDNELSESDLDLIAAAAKIPIHTNNPLHEKE